MSDFKATRFGPDEDPHIPMRRGTDPLLELLVHKVVGMESRVGERIALELDTFKTELRKELREELREEIRLLVPQGDIEGHRRAHELMIRSSDRWEKFRFSILEHLAKGGAFAAAIYVAYALWEHFKREVNR